MSYLENYDIVEQPAQAFADAAPANGARAAQPEPTEQEAAALVDIQKRDRQTTKFAERTRWRGELSFQEWATELLEYLAEDFDALQGAFYVAPREEDEQEQARQLELLAVFALDREDAPDAILYGEGLVGQAAKSLKPRYLFDSEGFATRARSSMASITPAALFVLPLIYDNKLQGVLDLAFIGNVKEFDRGTLRDVADMIAGNINTIRNQEIRRKLYEESRDKTVALENKEAEMRDYIARLEQAQAEMKAVQIQLQDNEARLSSVINSASDEIIAVDMEERITFYNDETKERYPFINKDETFNLERVIEPGAEKSYRNALKQVRKGKSAAFEVETQDADGNPLYKEVNINPIRSAADGAVFGATINRRDVSKRKLAESEIKQLNENLEKKVSERTGELEAAMNELKSTQSQLVQSEKMATLGQLVAGVAHEINTPLGVINGANKDMQSTLPETLEKLPEFYADLDDENRSLFFKLVEQSANNEETLSSKQEREMRKEVAAKLQEVGVDDARNTAKRLIRLGITEGVADFKPLLEHKDSASIMQMAANVIWMKNHLRNIDLAVAKMQKIVFALKNYSRKQHEEDFIEVDIAENIDLVLTIYHNQIKNTVKVSRDFDEYAPQIKGLPDELNQVWTNIIHNALQAMKYEGELKVGVRRAVELEEEYVVATISDNGPGIPKDVLPKIFEAFYTTKPQGEGTGLGLDICRKIIDKHQGKIEVESAPGNTTFKITLPVKPKPAEETTAAV